jgi:Cu/Zn superoxide dismutase
MSGLAFDKSAPQGSGIDKVSVFLDDRDAGGQHLGDATLDKANFSVTADFSRANPGSHTLHVYARSALGGREVSVNFPINVAAR